MVTAREMKTHPVLSSVVKAALVPMIKSTADLFSAKVLSKPGNSFKAKLAAG